ncbi:hypothetical protein QAD02_005849 [Eretmocerus hayati]|uniref:Uncharacterized protein n=1 Tax=Eretmocerus hayati TaxID=131215 RepID=A0ACC2NU01_9HYME|nr:hypothetical protein QAD02_005849 [Eretmocerus hayati]
MGSQKCWFTLCVFVSGMICVCSSQNLVTIILDMFKSSLNQIEDQMRGVRMIYDERSTDKNVSLRSYALDESTELLKHLHLEKPFVLYIHGYQEHPQNESIQKIVSEYLKRGDDNIVILDWSALAFDSYVSVTARIKDISRHTAKAIEELVSGGVNKETLHVIGHSMGAQVAGFIGDYLNFTIPRVTGLDPANPLFYQFGLDHISPRSGKIVDVIHTDGGLYGAYSNTGTVDFYANSGSRPQPGCKLFGPLLSPTDLCSHWRSWRYYAESINNEKSFPALRCDSYDDFIVGRCANNRRVYFGYALPKDL